MPYPYATPSRSLIIKSVFNSWRCFSKPTGYVGGFTKRFKPGYFL